MTGVVYINSRCASTVPSALAELLVWFCINLLYRFHRLCTELTELLSLGKVSECVAFNVPLNTWQVISETRKHLHIYISWLRTKFRTTQNRRRAVVTLPLFDHMWHCYEIALMTNCSYVSPSEPFGEIPTSDSRNVMLMKFLMMYRRTTQ